MPSIEEHVEDIDETKDNKNEEKKDEEKEKGADDTCCDSKCKNDQEVVFIQVKSLQMSSFKKSCIMIYL